MCCARLASEVIDRSSSLPQDTSPILSLPIENAERKNMNEEACLQLAGGRVLIE
jgi:hypothetical protein